jgi:hypothetical protein
MSRYRKMENLRGMLDELLNLGEGLTAWEVEFIDSLDKWSGAFTPRQAKKLEDVHRRLFG